jgi:hypothetical protein
VNFLFKDFYICEGNKDYVAQLRVTCPRVLRVGCTPIILGCPYERTQKVNAHPEYISRKRDLYKMCENERNRWNLALNQPISIYGNFQLLSETWHTNVFEICINNSDLRYQ